MKYSVNIMVEGDVVPTTVDAQSMDQVESKLSEDFKEFEILSIEKVKDHEEF